MDFARVGRALLEFFAQRQVPAAVVGGFGLQALGIQRATFDLDLVTLRSGQAELVAYLESLGYETLHASTGYSNHLHPDAAMGRVDFVYIDETTAAQLFPTATSREILPGWSALVPRPEHLAAMKVRALVNDPARRHQELADIRRLLELPGVDRALIRSYFERLLVAELYDQLTLGL